ncbi:Mov34/MPN/PAD-1 family protein [Paenibacillus sp. L3-i20]|uniref:Mov34/MPN/PAD-1 family protein n=1 Tax=Paenibacillus sp. L3-i20 TaxID=2905833 RepID=UPI001EE0E915|nr:M67 family metallopeptidase [Paenibacillus sp. L3-i20]GKU79777.1 Mov34/MPN/PAD-1 family protein [Paenibacillus sp. L3-i20]
MRWNEPTIKLTKSAFDDLIRISSLALPFEACGVVARSEHGDAADIILPIRNVHSSPSNSFKFDPEEWTNVFFAIQRNRQTLVGIYHSHPQSAPDPSLRDYSGFVPASDLSYWIVSLNSELHPLVKTYMKTTDSFKPIPLVLT